MTEKIEVSKDFIKALAQHAADTSAMFMPMSGFAMIGAAMMAKAAGDLIGEEIQATEKAFLGTVKMVEAIKAPYTEELEKLGKQVEELRHKIWEQPITDKASLSKAIAFLKKEIESTSIDTEEEKYFCLTEALHVVEFIEERIS